MSKLIVHTAVKDERGNVVWLAPGDTLPKWAADQVGAHCLAAGRHAEPEAAKDDVTEKDVADETTGADADTEPEGGGADDGEKGEPDAEQEADFTKPAARRGRPRKTQG